MHLFEQPQFWQAGLFFINSGSVGEVLCSIGFSTRDQPFVANK
jgi:hypothetical protein